MTRLTPAREREIDELRAENTRMMRLIRKARNFIDNYMLDLGTGRKSGMLAALDAALTPPKATSETQP